MEYKLPITKTKEVGIQHCPYHQAVELATRRLTGPINKPITAFSDRNPPVELRYCRVCFYVWVDPNQIRELDYIG